MVGVLALRSELGLGPDNLKSVHCFLAPGSLRALIYPRPTTGLEAKFSLEYALAAGILDGAYTLWSFTDEAVNRPTAQRLLPRIHVSEDARCAEGDAHATTRGPSRRGFVEVHAQTLKGEKAMCRVDKLPGSPDWELSREELRDKFMDCASVAHLDQARAGEAFERIASLQCEAKLDDVLELLRP